MKIYATLRRVFNNPASREFKIWHGTVAFWIFASCMSLALETVPQIESEYKDWFFYIEWLSVAVFTIDYVANLFLAERPLRYILSFWGVIDLLSILPSYLLVFNLTALQGSKVLRLIRLARILRVLKLARMASSAEQDMLMANLRIYLIVFFSVLMISSTSMYFVEGNLYSPEEMEQGQISLQREHPNEQVTFVPHDPITGTPIPTEKRFFTSIPAAMWWCVTTITSTGYGDMYPVTVGGRLVASVTMVLGLVLFGILLNLIGKALMMFLFAEEHR